MNESSHQPLAGVRIVDLTHDWAGPRATRLMADYGADVIKIEYPRRLDGMRGAYTEEKKYDRHPRWWQINRNKRSITLDLHLPRHVQAFKDLVRLSDVVVENSRPGVLDRLGLGYEVLRTIRPDLIMVSMSAFGATGPESHYAGYGGCIEALSGVQVLTRYERDGPAMRIREVDVTNGLMGACAIMTALIHRQRTGRGQWIDLSQHEACTWLIGEHLLEYALNGASSLSLGSRHHTCAPQGCYPCDGEDKWIVLSIRSDEEWRMFCTAIGHPEWGADPRFAAAEGRMRHHDQLDRLIGEWTRDKAASDVIRQLQEAGVTAGLVAKVEDIAADPHLAARAWFQFPDGQKQTRYPGFPFRLGNGGGVFARRGPDLGKDNEAILCDLLGMSKGELLQLNEDTIGTAFDLE